MPDPNKLQVLREHDYVIMAGCGECQHGRFAPGSNFGQCVKIQYDHAKHGQRNLSVHRSGRCRKPDLFELNEKKMHDIARSGYTEFMVEPEAADA